MSRISQQQLESYLWGAATLLRGVIDAGDYKQFIFPLLFFKRICDVYDEEYQQALDESGGDVDYATFAENHRFQIPKGAQWQDVRAKSTNVGQTLQKAMREIETGESRSTVRHLWRRAVDEQGSSVRCDAARSDRALLIADVVGRECARR